MSSSAFPGWGHAGGGEKPSSNDPSLESKRDAIAQMNRAARSLDDLKRAEHERKEEAKLDHLNYLRESILAAERQGASKSEVGVLTKLYRSSALELRPVSYEEAKLKEESIRQFAISDLTFQLERQGVPKNKAMATILKQVLFESRAESLSEEVGAQTPTPEDLRPPEDEKMDAILDVLGEVLIGGDFEISDVVERIAAAEVQSSIATQDPSVRDRQSQQPTAARANAASSTESSRESDEELEIVFEESPPAAWRRSSTNSSEELTSSSYSESSRSESEGGAEIEVEDIDLTPTARELEPNPERALEASPTTTTARERSKSWSYGHKAATKPANSPLGLSASSPDFQQQAVRDITNL